MQELPRASPPCMARMPQKLEEKNEIELSREKRHS